jgi:acyl carrier protein
VVMNEISTGELRAFLRERLPEYMVPASFIQMKELPRTENGKIDRAALPLHDGAAQSDATFELPRTETEKRLAEVWRELLSKPVIGIHDSFFSLGGHSLIATRMVSSLRSIFSIDLALRTVFESPTIAELAVEIERHLESTAPVPIPRAADLSVVVDQLSEAEIDAMLEELKREEGIG